jgi:hypothetical protein
MKNNSSKNVATRSRVREQFDLNIATVAGTVMKLWGRNRDVFLRLRVSLRGNVQETEDTQSCYVTIRIPDGMIGGKLVTLQPGVLVRVEGYLTHANYEETIRRFLSVAGGDNFLERNVPSEDLEAWRSIQFSRQNAILNALKIEMIKKEHVSQDGCANIVDIEGVIARKWEYPRDQGIDQFVRIAVYDEYAPVSEGKKGNFGRPYRQPHYVNILLANGKTADGVEIKVAKKQRIRIRGEFRDQGRKVSLRDALMSIGSGHVAELMSRVIDPETMNEIVIQHESLHILANAVIVYN